MTNRELFDLAYQKVRLELSVVQDKFNILKILEETSPANWTAEHEKALKELANK
jgi:hypothetical protein